MVAIPQDDKSLGLYVAFKPTPERIQKGAHIGTCKGCGRLQGHYPKDSRGHTIICLTCADTIPQIRRHIDELAKARGD